MPEESGCSTPSVAWCFHKPFLMYYGLQLQSQQGTLKPIEYIIMIAVGANSI